MKVTPAISTGMEQAISLWSAIYTDQPFYDRDNNKLRSLNLGYTIANEKARMACLELQTKVIDPNSEEDEEGHLIEDENSRAAFLNKQYQGLITGLRHKIAPGVALGSMVIKPVVDLERNMILFEFVMANEFFPITFTTDGQLVHAIFVEHITKGKKTYTRLETHELKGGTITVKQEAYEQEGSGQYAGLLGNRISLTDVAEWQNIQPQITITSTNGVKLDRLLVAYFTMPESNSIDIHSKLGISAYAPATDLIKQAYEIYSSMCWEFEGGEMAVDAPRGALKEYMDEHGVIITAPAKQQRLFRTTQVDKSSGDEMFSVFNPQLREQSFLNGLNFVLSQIEDSTGLSRGTLSSADMAAKTATEIKSLKQRTYQSNHDLQQKLESTLRDIAYILDIYTSIYGMAPSGEYEMTFDWDDSVLVDVSEELSQKSSLMAQGALMAEEVACWYLGTSLEQRFKDIQKYKELQAQYDPQPELEEPEF